MSFNLYGLPYHSLHSLCPVQLPPHFESPPWSFMMEAISLLSKPPQPITFTFLMGCSSLSCVSFSACYLSATTCPLLGSNLSFDLSGSPLLIALGYPCIVQGSNNVYGRVTYVHSIPFNKNKSNPKNPSAHMVIKATNKTVLALCLWVCCWLADNSFWSLTFGRTYDNSNEKRQPRQF